MVYGRNNQIIIVIVDIVVVSAIIYFLIKNYKKIDTFVKTSLMMVACGGISNLIDRLFRGYVVDYIDINQIFNYPVFNVADISITIGIVLLIGYTIINIIKKQENA